MVLMVLLVMHAGSGPMEIQKQLIDIEAQIPAKSLLTLLAKI